MTFGSLFAGIGGFDLGLERAGMTPAWQVEIDPFCRAVLAKHWPNVRRYDDVREVHATGVCGAGAVCDRCLPAVDVLCGGFPCQDISPAGRRAGIRGKQSGLWAEFYRLICELQPRYVVVENSSNLLADGYGMDVVVGELAAGGYDAEWDCLPAAAFGAPHERERVWIVAYPGSPKRRPRYSDGLGVEGPYGHSARSEDWREAQGSGVAEERAEPLSNVDEEGRHEPRVSVSRLKGQDRADTRRNGSDDADTDQARRPLIFGRAAIPELFRFRTAHSAAWWRVEPEMVRVVHGISAGLVRRRERHNAQIGALGNAVVPQITEWLGRRVMAYEQEWK